MNKNSIFENISTRRSIRAFTQQPIAKADLETIVRAGAWAPTAMNRQTFQFTVISRQEEIERLAGILGKEMGNAAYDFYKPAALILVSNEREGTNPVADVAALWKICFYRHTRWNLAQCGSTSLKICAIGRQCALHWRLIGIPQQQNCLGGLCAGIRCTEGSLCPGSAVSDPFYRLK